MASQWYCSRDGKTKTGPYSDKDLKQRVLDGELKPTDLIWRDGMDDWVAASKLKGLFSPASKETITPPLPGARPAKSSAEQTKRTSSEKTRRSSSEQPRKASAEQPRTASAEQPKRASVEQPRKASAERPSRPSAERSSQPLPPTRAMPPEVAAVANEPPADDAPTKPKNKLVQGVIAGVVGLAVSAVVLSIFNMKPKDAEKATPKNDLPKVAIAPVEKKTELSSTGVLEASPETIAQARALFAKAPPPQAILSGLMPSKKPTASKTTVGVKPAAAPIAAIDKQPAPAPNLPEDKLADAKKLADQRKQELFKMAELMEGQNAAFVAGLVKSIEETGVPWAAADTSFYQQKLTHETGVAYQMWRSAKIAEQVLSPNRPKYEPPPPKKAEIEVVHKIETPAPVLSVTFSPEGARLASGHEDKKVRLWDVNNGKLIREINADGAADAIAFAEDGRLFFSSGKHIFSYETETGKRKSQSNGHQSTVREIVVSKDGKAFLSAGGGDKTIRVWDPRNGKQLNFFTVPATGKAAFGIDVSADEKFLAIAHGGITIAPIASLRDSNAISAFNAERVRFTPDGATLISAHADGHIVAWNLEKRIEQKRITGHNGRIHDLALLSGGDVIATAGDDKTVAFWNLATGAEIIRFSQHSAPVLGLSPSPDPGVLATASEDKSIYILNLSK